MNNFVTLNNTGPAIRITLIYFVVGILWITFSDLALENLVHDSETLAKIGTLKGWLFILLTSAMVFLLIRKQVIKQQQVEQKLREREHSLKKRSDELRIIIDNIPSFIIYKNDKNVILRVNKHTAEAAGTTKEAMAGKPSELFYPEHAEEYYKDDLEVIHTGQPKLGILEQIATADDSKKWIETSKIPIHTQAGKATEILVIANDITERKLAEEKLQQQQALLKAIFNDIPDALMMADLNRRILLSNLGVSRIFGYDADEIIGKSTETLYQNKEDFINQGKQRFNRNADVALSPYIVNYQRKNGEVFPGESIGAIIKDTNEQPIGYLGLIRDVSDRIALEQEARNLRENLAHVNRLSTMSEMTAGIAHEINQPLTAISNYAQASLRLLETDPTSPRLAGALQKISDQALRAADIIRKLRDFIKQRESRHESVDCNEMIRKIVQLAEVDTGINNIPVILQFSENLPVVYVDPVQIQQVILNLVRNAMDALTSVHTQQPEIVISSSLDSNNILIVVEDNGPGITKGIAANIFTPFVSTKTGGMGMGLAISRTIIRSHGGELNYEARSSGGSRFYFTLPVIIGA